MSKTVNFIKNISPFNNRTEMPKILYIIKVILIFFLFKFGGEIVAEGIVLAVHFACGKNPLAGEMFDANTILIITYLGYSIVIGVIVLLWKLFQKKTLRDLGFTKRAGSYFAGIAIGTGLLALCVIPVVLTGTITFNGVFGNINIGIILVMIVCFVLQGAMEEVLCRGVVQQLLIRKTSAPVAAGVSTILFTVLHLNNMTGAGPAITAVAIINLVLISLIFSLLTLRFKSIWAACGMHSFWNYILFNIMGLNLSGNDEVATAVFDMRSVGNNILNGGIYGIEASIITTGVLAAALALCVLASRKELLPAGRPHQVLGEA